eukprot:m.104459 g.104459  ORF g.104459 m.104459 type:complete len:575 (-) comp15644_c0_seq3:85-1809(-)
MAVIPALPTAPAEGDCATDLAAESPAPVVVEFEPVGRWFFAHQRRRHRGLSVSVCEDDSDEDEVSEEETSGEDSGEEDDDVYTSIDAGNWKNQDHYAVMGLGHLRWKATQDDIKRAYKKAVLKHHPDKKESTTEDQAQENELFTCIQKANEILTDPKKRRLYDSIDEFDDSVPSITRDVKQFFSNFGPTFEANSRWMEQQPAPELGDDDTPYEQVEAFYQYWLDAKSWREFGYFDKEDPSDADSREERRYIERQNKAARKKKKKEEYSRLHRLVDNAMASDPRLRRHREEQKRAKQEKKKKKQEERRAVEEAKRAEAAAKEAARLQAEQEAKVVERKRAEDGRKMRRTFTKACKRHGLLSESLVEELRGAMPLERLQEICAVVQDKEQFQPLVEAELENLRAAQQKAKQRAEAEARPWSTEEQKALEAAMKTVPKDAKDRWSQIAAHVPDRSKRDCVRRVQALAAKAKDQKAGKVPPTEWTEEELSVLVKAASKVYPPGTQGDRWGLLAEYVQTHAHTTWRRVNKDIIEKVNSMKNVAAGLQGKKEKSKDPMVDFKANKRDRSKPSESKPTQRL